MTRTLQFVIFLLSAWVGACLQQSPSAGNVSSVAGTVIKEPGSEPLKKVLVQVVAENQKVGGNYTAQTDADGRFQIDNVQPARYRLFIEKTGFVGVNERGLKSDASIFTVQAGQSVEGLVLRMLPTAVITGRVTDQDGDPMSGVSVIAQKRTPGKAKRENVASGTTNDLGEFRLASLFPGQYWIVALPPPDFRDYAPTQQKPVSGQNENRDDSQSGTRYLATYYPDTYDASLASPVTLKAGDEVPINFTLIPAKTYQVRGIVTGVPHGLQSAVELVSKTGDSYRANATEIGPDGQFEVRGVGPGSYVLKASAGNDSQSLMARQEISVVSADVDGIKLVPQPSFTISGHLRVENYVGDPAQYSANLRQAELSDDPAFFMTQEGFGSNAVVDRAGNFEWKNVVPGNYIVQVFGGDDQGFFLRSATLGGRDISTGFTASGPVTVELVVSTKGGTIEGTVLEKEKDVDDDHPASSATVVAVPEEKYRNLPDRFLASETDQHGRFMIRGLPPGSYTLYAWQDLEDGVYKDPDFLRSQEAKGMAVKVEENSNQKVELRLSSVAGEWR
jgi:hypothetical protein